MQSADNDGDIGESNPMNQLAPRRRIGFCLILIAEAIGYKDVVGLMCCGILASSCGSVQLHF